MQRNEQLQFAAGADFGACRHCARVIGKKDKRNLRVGLMIEDDFITAIILVSETAFRCAFCFTRHQFEPFRRESVPPQKAHPRLTR